MSQHALFFEKDSQIIPYPWKQPHCLIFLNISALLFLWVLIFPIGMKTWKHENAWPSTQTTSHHILWRTQQVHNETKVLVSCLTDTGCSHAMRVVLLCSSSGLQRTNKHYTRLMERLQLHKNNTYKQGQRAKSINLRGFRDFSEQNKATFGTCSLWETSLFF